MIVASNARGREFDSQNTLQILHFWIWPGRTRNLRVRVRIRAQMNRVGLTRAPSRLKLAGLTKLGPICTSKFMLVKKVYIYIYTNLAWIFILIPIKPPSYPLIFFHIVREKKLKLKTDAIFLDKRKPWIPLSIIKYQNCIAEWERDYEYGDLWSTFVEL